MALLLLFTYQDTQHDVYTHYIIYDGDSFIADVGGFLGLLLGHSAYSLWIEVEGWIMRRMITTGKVRIA
jgi:hypothetical protein